MAVDGRPKAIYLDQWVWIQLARTRLGRTSPISSEVRDELVAKRLAGVASFPLSEVHYMETWKQRSVRRRSELAVEMGLLSGFETVAPIRAIWPVELDRALHSRFGRPESPSEPTVFGRGLSFAMDQPDQPEIDALDSERRFLLEWQLLRSPEEERFAAEGQQRRDADNELAEKANKMSEALKEWYIPTDEKAQRFRIQTLSDLDYQFFGRLIAAEVTPEDLTSLGADGLEPLVRDMPTLWVLTELRRLRHRNPAQPFTATDLNDLRALAVAVVYCDVVIADKAWVHALQQSGLPERYGTVVSGDPELAAF
jgi:hypothetical protein